MRRSRKKKVVKVKVDRDFPISQTSGSVTKRVWPRDEELQSGGGWKRAVGVKKRRGETLVGVKVT